jgi:hypothetical protein
MPDRLGKSMFTYTGKMFYPLDPREEDINLSDIAHALSLICRFGGHSRFHYSVAAHGLLVKEILRQWGYGPRIQLIGLLHNASTAYMGDMVYALEGALTNYAQIEGNIQKTINSKFGLYNITFNEQKVVSDAHDFAMGYELHFVLGSRPLPVMYDAPSMGELVGQFLVPGKLMTNLEDEYTDAVNQLQKGLGDQ